MSNQGMACRERHGPGSGIVVPFPIPHPHPNFPFLARSSTICR